LHVVVVVEMEAAGRPAVDSEGAELELSNVSHKRRLR